ncbi:MAG: hypothetical protein JW778_06950, partial [Candidatus Altiarchaeota archaeon]|nr:hypothetical protein [Candidatus Altiarchaeota archaeon]
KRNAPERKRNSPTANSTEGRVDKGGNPQVSALMCQITYFGVLLSSDSLRQVDWSRITIGVPVSYLVALVHHPLQANFWAS